MPDHRLTIVLAEDVRANQTVLTRLLQSEGHRVVVASNGREAIECMETNEVDAVLLDVQMPLLNGYETFARIRNIEKTQNRGHTPIIGMTAHETREVRNQCLSAGMDAYLPKPIDMPKLVAILAQLVSRTSRDTDETAPTVPLLYFGKVLGRFVAGLVRASLVNFVPVDIQNEGASESGISFPRP